MTDEPTPQFRGVFIPAKIWRDPALSWMDKALLAEIDALDDGEGCYASNAYLAKMMGSPATEKSISNKIGQLRDQGYIVDRRFDGRRRFISVSYAPEAMAAKKALGLQKDASTSGCSQPPLPGGPCIHAQVDIGTSTESSTAAQSAVSSANAADEVKVTKPKAEPSDQGKAFAAWFQSLLPENLRKQSPAELANWAKCYDDMLRLDGRTKEQVVDVCEWARGDNFWKKNFFTPLKLRDKSDSAGVKYFDLFLEKMPKAGRTKAPGAKAVVGIPTKPKPNGHEFTADVKPAAVKPGGLAALKAQREAQLKGAAQTPPANENLPLPLS